MSFFDRFNEMGREFEEKKRRSAARGEVVVKSRGAPALNVEVRVIEQSGPISEVGGWIWVDAVMARGPTVIRYRGREAALSTLK
jgi:hypothetical protein